LELKTTSYIINFLLIFIILFLLFNSETHFVYTLWAKFILIRFVNTHHLECTQATKYRPSAPHWLQSFFRSINMQFIDTQQQFVKFSFQSRVEILKQCVTTRYLNILQQISPDFSIWHVNTFLTACLDRRGVGTLVEVAWFEHNFGACLPLASQSDQSQPVWQFIRLGLVGEFSLVGLHGRAHFTQFFLNVTDVVHITCCWELIPFSVQNIFKYLFNVDTPDVH